MPCIFTADMRHVNICLPKIKYALHIKFRHVAYLIISPSINYALHIPGRCATDVIISTTIKYALYINGRYVTDLHNSPHLSMPCIYIYMSDMRHIDIFLTTIKYALHIRSRNVENVNISPPIKYALNNPVRFATKLLIYPHN